MKADTKQQELTDNKTDNIIEWLEETTGFEFASSSIYRKGDKGVHGTYPSRGNDLICRVMPIGKAISDYINKNWSYDYKRPEKKCCVFHNSGSGFHLHIQSHPNTRMTI